MSSTSTVGAHRRAKRTTCPSCKASVLPAPLPLTANGEASCPKCWHGFADTDLSWVEVHPIFEHGAPTAVTDLGLSLLMLASMALIGMLAGAGELERELSVNVTAVLGLVHLGLRAGRFSSFLASLGLSIAMPAVLLGAWLAGKSWHLDGDDSAYITAVFSAHVVLATVVAALSSGSRHRARRGFTRPTLEPSRLLSRDLYLTTLKSVGLLGILGQMLLTLVVFDVVGDGSEQRTLLWVVFILLVPQSLAGGTVSLAWLGAVWARIPPSHARTTPLKAVAFLFVPLFNLYWVFRVIVGLARDLNRALEHLDPERAEFFRVSPRLALAICFVPLLVSVPFIGILAAPLSLFLTLKFTAHATDAANALVLSSRPA